MNNNRVVVSGRRWRLLMMVAVLALCAAAWLVWADGDWPADRVIVRTPGGSLAFTFRLSYGANLFYVVDQVSRWDQHTRTYYRDNWEKRFELTAQDRRMLDRYARLRSLYPWGVLEPAFFGAGGDKEARRRLGAIATPEDAVAILKALSHFQGRFDKLWAEAVYMEGMTKDLAASMTTDHRRLIDQVTVFFESEPHSLDVLPIYSPEPTAGGGGFNGGRIALEMPKGRPVQRLVAVLLHEAFHALQDPKEEQLQAFSTKNGLPPGVVHEALLYAVSPGVSIRRLGGTDPIPEQIARMEKLDISPDDQLYQTRKLALALEPTLDDYLKQGKRLAEFLPRMASTWDALVETDPYLSQVQQLESRPASTGALLSQRDGTLVVTGFEPGAAARGAGMRIGDEIVSVRGKTLDEWKQMGVSAGKVSWRELRGAEGETIVVQVSRDGGRVNVRVSLQVVAATDEMPDEAQVLAIARRQVAEALGDRLQVYVDAFSPELIPQRRGLIARKPLIIAISLDSLTIPAEHRDLVPMDYDDLVTRLRKGETVSTQAEAVGGPVVLLGAPSQGRLLRLIDEYDFSAVLKAVRQQTAPAPETSPATSRFPGRGGGAVASDIARLAHARTGSG